AGCAFGRRRRRESHVAANGEDGEEDSCGGERRRGGFAMSQASDAERSEVEMSEAPAGQRLPEERPPEERPPESPTELPKRSWWTAVRRSMKEFSDDNLSDAAAALTYYATLSVFPALLVLVSLVGLTGPDTAQKLVDNLGQVVPG